MIEWAIIDTNSSHKCWWVFDIWRKYAFGSRQRSHWPSTGQGKKIKNFFPSIEIVFVLELIIPRVLAYIYWMISALKLIKKIIIEKFQVQCYLIFFVSLRTHSIVPLLLSMQMSWLYCDICFIDFYHIFLFKFPRRSCGGEVKT